MSYPIDKKAVYMARYPKGTIIELVEPLEDPYAPKPIGSRFKVDCVDDALQLQGVWLPPQSGSIAVIIEKDKTEHTSTVTNTDSGSMEMTTEKESGEETVYEESGGEKAPYVSKEILPEIEGVLVVAEGGDSPRIVSDISDAVKALFQVEAHRIKVVKMSSKEDGT